LRSAGVAGEVKPLGRRGLLRAALGLVALVALGFAFAQTWDRSRGLLVPGWPQLLGAGALIAIGLYCGGQGWVYLLERRGSRALAATFYLSQIGKYIPGAIWQPAGQLSMAVASGVPTHIAATAVPVYMLTLIAAGGTVGLGLLAVEGLGPRRGLALLGVALVLLLKRAWMARTLDRLHARFDRVPSGDAVPGQRQILASYAWSLGVMVTTGAAFFLLLTPGVAGVPVLAAVSAFAAAWTVGFLVLPVPAGLGIREAVLVGALATNAAPVIAASIFYRLVSIVIELGVVAVSRADRSLRQSRN
jgi:uncharacterized membrane protein YbhN (UPF0104 family)